MGRNVLQSVQLVAGDVDAFEAVQGNDTRVLQLHTDQRGTKALAMKAYMTNNSQCEVIRLHTLC